MDGKLIRAILDSTLFKAQFNYWYELVREADPAKLKTEEQLAAAMIGKAVNWFKHFGSMELPAQLRGIYWCLECEIMERAATYLGRS